MGINAQTSVPSFSPGDTLTAANVNLLSNGIGVFSGTATRDAAFGSAGEKTLAEGQFAYLEDTNSTQFYDGSNWVDIQSSQIASFTEYQANNTNGGTATSGAWTKRTINTTLTNSIISCTLTSSVISLPAGTYAITATSSFYATSSTQIKLRNTTDSSDTIMGAAVFNNVTNGGSAASLNGTFTITGTKNFEIQYRVGATKASEGLGTAMGFGSTECFLTCTIEKVA
jgi:hypothetical protein